MIIKRKTFPWRYSVNIDKELIKCVEKIDLNLEKRLNENYKYINEILDSIKYSVFTGGKRIRPILAMKSYELFSENNNYDNIMPFALAIEMIHTYSLIHDDLPSMDNDDYRRGKLSNHKVYGEALAILSGDGLLNLAFETIFDSFKDLGDLEDHRRKILTGKEISRYSGLKGMIGGQVIDMNQDKKEIEDDELLYMYKTKTAALIKAATVSGAIIGGANKEEIETMRKFGYYLGMSYQIKDDILDKSEDENIEKLTYLSHFGVKKSDRDLKVFSDKAKLELRKLKGKDINFLMSLTDILINREV